MYAERSSCHRQSRGESRSPRRQLDSARGGARSSGFDTRNASGLPFQVLCSALLRAFAFGFSEEGNHAGLSSFHRALSRRSWKAVPGLEPSHVSVDASEPRPGCTGADVGERHLADATDPMPHGRQSSIRSHWTLGRRSKEWCSVLGFKAALAAVWHGFGCALLSF